MLIIFYPQTSLEMQQHIPTATEELSKYKSLASLRLSSMTVVIPKTEEWNWPAFIKRPLSSQSLTCFDKAIKTLSILLSLQR